MRKIEVSQLTYAEPLVITTVPLPLQCHLLTRRSDVPVQTLLRKERKRQVARDSPLPELGPVNPRIEEW